MEVSAPMDLGDVTDLYVISDLHIGGAEGFQMFRQHDALARFFRKLASLPQGGVALVLNGDVLDFLAEKPWTKFDLDSAPARMTAIVAREARRVAAAQQEGRAALNLFEELRGVATRHLVVVALGNHDLETAHPQVKAILSGGAKFKYHTDGTPVIATVGGKRVVIVHGNQTDENNAVDYDELARIVDGVARPGPRFPNTGSRIVFEVLNETKSLAPFIDLIPYENWRTPVALLLEAFPEHGARLGKLLKAAGLKLGLLGDDAEGSPGGLEAPEAIYAQVERWYAAGEPLPPVGELLLWGWFRGPVVDAPPSAWFDLDALGSADSSIWDPRKKDGDVIIAGHTHTRRFVRDPSTGRLYMNTGTWADLIRVDDETVRNEWLFDLLIDALREGIDTLQRDGHLHQEQTYARVWTDNGIVTAVLRDAATAEDGGPIDQEVL